MLFNHYRVCGKKRCVMEDMRMRMSEWACTCTFFVCFLLHKMLQRSGCDDIVKMAEIARSVLFVDIMIGSIRLPRSGTIIIRVWASWKGNHSVFCRFFSRKARVLRLSCPLPLPLCVSWIRIMHWFCKKSIMTCVRVLISLGLYQLYTLHLEAIACREHTSKILTFFFRKMWTVVPRDGCMCLFLVRCWPW